MNSIIAALTADDRDALMATARVESCDSGLVLHEAGQQLGQIYFPIDAVVSHCAAHDDGAPVETGTVGREGVVAAVALMGDHVVFERAVVQVAGRIVVIPIETVSAALDRSPGFRRAIGAYLQAYAAQVAQSVVCNASHPSEARLARWLLMCLDRTGGDAPLELGNGLLAEMLGIGRPAVTVVTGALQTAGLIRSDRGAITVVDREGLEDAACDCYRRVRDVFERLLPTSYACG